MTIPTNNPQIDAIASETRRAKRERLFGVDPALLIVSEADAPAKRRKAR